MQDHHCWVWNARPSSATSQYTNAYMDAALGLSIAAVPAHYMKTRTDAGSSHQSSRSPSMLPRLFGNPIPLTRHGQEDVGQLHSPQRVPMQEQHQGLSTQPSQQNSDCFNQHSGEDIGWKLYCTASFTTAVSVIMAELTKQVEVHCSERAHALALTWNLFSAAMDTCQGTPLLCSTMEELCSAVSSSHACK